MSSDKDDKPKKKKKGGMLMKLMIPVVLIAASGGGVYGLVVAGVIGGGGHEEKEDTNPKLVKKGEEDPYAVKKEGEKEGEGGEHEVEGEGGSEYKTSYFTFTEEFTSNLKDSDSLVQVAIACSTRRDGRVLMWLKKHELAIRSAMLNVLADTPEEDIGSLAGKERMQKRLTATINQVLTKEEGFGGIDEVYFKSFLVQ